MKKGDRQLLVVGDRVLIRLEDGEERSTVGLYLPATAVDNQAVQGGVIVATGPGHALPNVDLVDAACHEILASRYNPSAMALQ